jgi:hypothetical protein
VTKKASWNLAKEGKILGLENMKGKPARLVMMT